MHAKCARSISKNLGTMLWTLYRVKLPYYDVLLHHIQSINVGPTTCSDLFKLVQTCPEMSRHVISRDFYNVKMLWTLLSKASTVIFCCIMSKARLTDTRWAGGHISVGPNTIAKLGICIRFFSLNVVTFSKCFSRNAKVALCEVGSLGMNIL